MTGKRIVGITLAACIAAWTADAGAQPKPGTVLDQSTWQQAEGFLPAEILNHFKKGEYANPVVEWKRDDYDWPPDFLAGSKANEGKYDVDESGAIIDVQTRQRPAFVFGLPFPVIDEADPKAGVKVVWNYFYRTWYYGNVRAESQLNWINTRGLERRADVLARFKYYDGIPEDERIENPSDLLNQNLALVTGPADLNGTAGLTWRYRDPNKRDSAWSYVPALRRVRAISPSNRSDGFLGSDISQDDGQFFDGKPEDFTWKLTRKLDELRYVDPMNLKGEWNIQPVPNGGAWRVIWPDIPVIGYMDPQWSGIAWAPRTAALALREHWVVEGVPHDKYYLFGRLELHVDTVTFQGAWNRKYSWSGELTNSFQVMSYRPSRVDTGAGKSIYIEGSNMAFVCNENVKHTRATIGGLKANPRADFDFRLTFEPMLFDMASLSRQGK